ncbi:MAG: Wzz/FepE/Etk N-terminal domain-containing protein [Terracidiphilus sp.]|jgi:polysaccharide chain length determinant protein (PEP-CTERM system associated)
MLGHRELTMRDYAEMLKRRFWLILTSTLLFLAIGLGISYVLPPEYVSQTLVLIEQQKVPEDYVKPVVEEDLSARLASMKEQIMSRSRIEPIVDRFGLYPGSKYTMDDRIELTQKAIGVKPIPSGQSSHGMPGFYITFKARDAQTAQKVCGEITSLFVSENLSAREQSAEGTTDFLKQQLIDSKRNLDEQDAKLAAFQSKYIGRLPDQESSNSNTLLALTTQLQAATQAANRAQQDETFLEAMIAEQSQQSSRTDPATGTSEDTLQIQLKDAITQQKEMEAIYTPDHPDISAIKRKIANLRTEIARAGAEPAKAGTAVNSSDSPQLQQLKAQLRAAKQSLAGAKQDQARIEQQVRAYEAKIESSPMVEEEYKQVTRDHETALQFYNTLLTKMNESSMATALEHRQQGEQFRVMDAPNLPEEPTFPNRRACAGGGLATGLLLGLLLSALFEYRDTSLRNESDIWAFTKLPTLAVISYSEELAQLRPAHEHGSLFSRMVKRIESARG